MCLRTRYPLSKEAMTFPKPYILSKTLNSPDLNNTFVVVNTLNGRKPGAINFYPDFVDKKLVNH